MVSGIVASLADHQIPTMSSEAERELIALSHVVGCRRESERGGGEAGGGGKSATPRSRLRARVGVEVVRRVGDTVGY